jgi:hypothetical protein
MSTDWYRSKADALFAAWQRDYGSDPPTHAVALCLAVATHETHCGDSWPGSHNWGATTLRALNAAEQAAVRAAGIAPSVGPGHEALAKKAQQAIVDAGLPLPAGEIHCDSAPSIGAYFVWFAAFGNDVDGAAYFLKLLAGIQTKKVAWNVLNAPGGTEQQLAAAMYAAGYYTGFYRRDKDYTLPGGHVVKGSELNVAAYAKALTDLTPAIRAALAGWAPAPPEPTDAPQPPAPVAPLLPMYVDWDQLRADRDAVVQGEDV